MEKASSLAEFMSSSFRVSRTAVRWLFVSVLMMMCDGVTFASEATPTNEQLLNKFAEATAVPQYLAIDATIVEEVSGSMPDAGKVVLRKAKIKCRKSGSNWHVWRDENGKFDKEGVLSDYSLLIEVLINDGKMTSVQVENSVLMVKAYLEASNHPLDPTVYLNVGGLMFGRLLHDRNMSIAQIAETSELSIRKRDVDADRNPFSILDIRGPYGFYALWLDPAQNYVPRRIQVVKRGSDNLLGKPVGETSGGGTLFFPKATLSKWELALSDAKTSLVDGRPFISEFTYVISNHYSNSQIVRVSTHYKCDKISTSQVDATDTPFVIYTKIPDKTRVYVKDAPGIRYAWEDGEIAVASIDPDIGGLELSQKTRRGWFLLGNVLVIAIIIILMILRGRMSSAS